TDADRQTDLYKKQTHRLCKRTGAGWEIVGEGRGGSNRLPSADKYADTNTVRHTRKDKRQGRYTH
ncbi:unnamed protein product, partial [Candidula unifasciata]